MRDGRAGLGHPAWPGGGGGGQAGVFRGSRGVLAFTQTLHVPCIYNEGPGTQIYICIYIYTIQVSISRSI